MMLSSGALLERDPPERLTEGIGSGSGPWRTPAAQEPGITIARLETKTGLPVGSLCRHYDKKTGRLAQIGLTQQVQVWPTPNARDYKGASDPEKRKAKGHQVHLNDQVAWPTPVASDRNQRRATENWEGSDLVSKATAKEEEEGRMQPKAGGKLSPDWVEWLMGWPIGWTSMEPLNRDRFRAWERAFATGSIGSSA
tara:strand:- start:367 stop:954 length:588 start_codon:yes stop_codon:yes gene_type:complete